MPMRKPSRKFSRKKYARKGTFKRRGYKGPKRYKKSFRKKSVPVKRKVAKMSKQLRRLESIDRATLGVLVYRQRATDVCSVTYTGIRDIKQRALFSSTKVATLLARLRYWNPTTGAFSTSAYSTQTAYVKPFRISGAMFCHIRNNGVSDAFVEVYRCTCKSDTTSGPESLYDSDVIALNQLAIPPNNGANMMFNIGDGRLLREQYRVKKIVSKHLKIGGSINVKSVIKPFELSTQVNAASVYSPRWRTEFLMVVGQGVIGYSTGSTSNINHAPFQLSMQWYETARIMYDAGASIKYIEVDDLRSQVITEIQTRNIPGHYGSAQATSAPP